MANSLTVELPDEVYEPLLARAKQTGKTPEEVVAECLAAVVQQFDDDPLLQLAGTIVSDITDVPEGHDY